MYYFLNITKLFNKIHICALLKKKTLIKMNKGFLLFLFYKNRCINSLFKHLKKVTTYKN
jgi:hypothetical protein